MDFLHLLASLPVLNAESSSFWNFMGNISDWLKPNLEQAYYLIASVLVAVFVAIRQLRPQLIKVIGFLLLAGLIILKPTILKEIVDFFSNLLTRKG